MISKHLVNKDYLKAIFVNDKKLLKLKDVRISNPPHYDEISVTALYEPCLKLPGMRQYFPDKYPKVSST